MVEPYEVCLVFALTVAAPACSSPPERFALYPGFTFEQMSRFEPGTGEYLEEHRLFNLEPVAIEIVDPTTSRAFVTLDGTFTAFSSYGRVLDDVSVHPPENRGRSTTGDSLVGTVRAFIDRGWQCRARDNPMVGPVFEASAIALPEGFCVATRTYDHGWTCRSPPGWPKASAYFVWGCGDATNNFSFGWSVDLLASRD